MQIFLPCSSWRIALLLLAMQTAVAGVVVHKLFCLVYLSPHISLPPFQTWLYSLDRFHFVENTYYLIFVFLKIFWSI